MNFLKKIFSPIFFYISFLVLVYIFYKSEIRYLGSLRSYYLPYYLISLILITFSIITFFINQKIKEYIIISGISLVISLYMFEGYLTFKMQLSRDPLIREQLYEKQTGNKWDTRDKYEIYKDLKKKNDEIVVSVSPKNTPFYTLAGISNSETIYCNENGYYSIYKSDRYGFNNPNTEWDKKEIEYLLVGDSFTHGACVNRPNDIGSVLRTLSNKSVLNLGYAGNGPILQYATLREYLNSNVKKVLWLYYEGNDLRNLANEKNDNFLVNYINDLNFTQNLKFKQDEIDDLAINILRELERKESERETFKFKLLRFIKIYNTRIIILPTPTPTIEFKKTLKLAKEIVNENNAKLYFVYLPEYIRYKVNYDKSKYNLVKKITSELNIPFIDIHKEGFAKEQNPLKFFPFELHAHYNVEGYKKVAETIYKLTKN